MSRRLGRAMAGANERRTLIIDVDTGQPCPVGGVGELVNVTGAGRFEGYYNDPEANAQRMAGGVYHSGDLAYRDEAGYAYFAGRLGDWLLTVERTSQQEKRQTYQGHQPELQPRHGKLFRI